MKENKKGKYSDEANCPVRNVLDKVGDKWSMLVVQVLDEFGVLRFNAIHKHIETISEKMLTVTLKSLEADGLIKRKVYAQIPPKVEYELTQRGQSLVPYLNGLVEWAIKNMGDIQKSRVTFERGSQKE